MNYPINNFVSPAFARVTSICMIVLGALSSLHADLDWGGGLTQFFGEDGQALTSETGYATLIAISEGELIDFRTYIPGQPSDLVSVGAELRFGENVNRVVASTTFFYSGYLLYSAIPDLTIAELEALGARDGELLYLVVWDRTTFYDGLPTDRSYYTAQPLYSEGQGDMPAVVRLSSDTVYAEIAHPDSALTRDWTLFEAERAGHNVFSGFLDWAQGKLELDAGLDDASARSLDSDQNGRSNYEEYVFNALPQLSLGVSSSFESEMEADGEGSASVDTPQFFVELRANDPSLSYTAYAAEDLGSWLSAEVYFAEGSWHSSEPAIEVTRAVYRGEGVWSVAMQYQDASASERCFYKMSVSEVGR